METRLSPSLSSVILPLAVRDALMLQVVPGFVLGGVGAETGGIEVAGMGTMGADAGVARNLGSGRSAWVVGAGVWSKRSNSHLIALATALIKQNRRRMPKAIKSMAPRAIRIHLRISQSPAQKPFLVTGVAIGATKTGFNVMGTNNLLKQDILYIGIPSSPTRTLVPIGRVSG